MSYYSIVYVQELENNNLNLFVVVQKQKLWNLEVITLLKCVHSYVECNTSWVNFIYFLENAPSHTSVNFNQLKLTSLHVQKKLYLKWKVRMM